MLAQQIWKSVTELENRSGILFFDGCDVRELVQRFGTPLYVYSQSRIQDNYRRLVRAYRTYYPNFQVYYAVKANNNPAIVRLLADEGCGADASCLNEILIAQRAGVSSDKILYSGVCTANRDLKYAVGQVCENSDVFAKNRHLPSSIKVDDLLALLNTGAYGFCMSSQYNSQPKAAEVLVHRGQAAIIRERETFADLVKGTHLPRFA